MAGALAQPVPSLLPPRPIDSPVTNSTDVFLGPQEVLFIEWKGNKRLTNSPVKCLCKACLHRWTVPASAANALAQQQGLSARLMRKGNKDMHEGAQGLILQVHSRLRRASNTTAPKRLILMHSPPSGVPIVQSWPKRIY